MTPGLPEEDPTQAWSAALGRQRAARSSAARVPLTPDISVWLPGCLRESSIPNANEFLGALESFLRREGLTVVRPSEEQPGLSVAAGCPVVIAITLSVGTCAEAVDFANNRPPAGNLFVFIPAEHHDGYVNKAMERMHVPVRLFNAMDVSGMKSALPLKVIAAVEEQISQGLQVGRLEERDRRCAFPASVVFVELQGIRSNALAPYAAEALAALQQLSREAKGSNRNLSVHSTLSGALAVVQDGNGDVRGFVDSIMSATSDKGLSIRVAVTHGDVERVTDIDKTVNYISPIINRAARIAVAPENPGVLLDDTYWRHAVDHLRDVPLGDPLEIHGKRSEIFCCKSYPGTPLQIMTPARFPQLTYADAIDAIFLAYDLPRFSDGDRWMLIRRSAEMADQVWRSLTADIQQFYYSPGGDGGVIVIPAGERAGLLTKETAYQRAVAFHEGLVKQGRALLEDASVRCRVGVHYGQVRLYGVGGRPRPTGAHLFAADMLANDEVARQVDGVVVSEAILEALEGGCKADQDTKFRELDGVETPVGRIRRFIRRV